MCSWPPAARSACRPTVRGSLPTATLGWVAGMMVKCPEVVTTLAAGLVVTDGLGAGEAVAGALRLPVPAGAAVT